MGETKKLNLDHFIIFSIVRPRTRVLDLGCGNGDLLYALAREKQVRAQGIELNEQAIQACVAKGLNVIHGDIESSLKEYPEDSFDYVILNQSMQQVRNVDWVIDESLRIAKEVIVGFPNFAHIKSRMKLFFSGRFPVTESLPYRWYDTPNLRFLSIKDFEDFCYRKNILITQAHYLGKRKKVHFLPNVLACDAILVLRESKEAENLKEESKEDLCGSIQRR